MLAAAARVGAPLGHDFCAINLSDNLKPWTLIETRLRAALAGDFAIALYNPRSAARPAGFGRALAILREGADTIAGFFAEPVQGAGGVIPPSKGYFQAVLPILRKYDIPMISDEVITGFGRTGNTWGCQTYDFMPDAIISSKNLTAGFFPMGAVILGPNLAARVGAAVEAIEEFPHGFTAAGHPVGCAIALKAIDVVMNEGLADNVRRLAPRFEEGLKRLAEKPNIGEYRGVGFMWALEAVRDKATKTPFDAHLSVSERIANACTDLGLICRPLGQSIVLCPPFILTEPQMDEIFDKLERALKTVFADVA